MYLVYLDESGNTGNNLLDGEQPVFVLAALIVPEQVWQGLERDLEQAVTSYVPALAGEHEIHAMDLRAGRGIFKGIPVATRLAIRDTWLWIAQQHGLRVVYRAIEKRRYQAWLHREFGTGIIINPHVAAFPLVAGVVDDYLNSLPERPLGMFISDENKEIVSDVEKSIRFLRGSVGNLRLNRIVEKGFFIDSRKSRPLQLCDVAALWARKKEERLIGRPSKTVDDVGIELLDPLIARGNEKMVDVLAWLAEQQKGSTAQKNSGQG
ncbi:MAG: DUF3800 domain-containing protein [Planctomycetes bacterium]|nr:DUF3800 domain-containing protein [Planctomycetota bacterium]